MLAVVVAVSSFPPDGSALALSGTRLVAHRGLSPGPQTAADVLSCSFSVGFPTGFFWKEKKTIALIRWVFCKDGNEYQNGDQILFRKHLCCGIADDINILTHFHLFCWVYKRENPQRLTFT